MNYSLLTEQRNNQINLSPRLIQYLKAKEYHNMYNIKPPISLDKQFQITKSDRYIISKYLKQFSNKKLYKTTHASNYKSHLEVEDAYKTLNNPNVKCVDDSCTIQASIKDYNRSLLGKKLPANKLKHPLVYDGLSVNNKKGVISDKKYSSKRDSHPWTYNNDIIVRRSPYTSDTKTMNRLVIEKQMKEKSIPQFSKTVNHTVCNSNTCKSGCSNGLHSETWTSADDPYIKNNKRNNKKDQPLKYMSIDFVKRGTIKNRLYKNKELSSNVYSQIVDFDTLLRHGKAQDKRKTKVVGKMDTSNKWLDYQNTECKKVPNVEQIHYQTTPYMGHGKGIGNVDVESSMWHAEPSRIAKHKDLGGVSINRFEDLFVDVQQNSVYPFDFPRGGIDSRDPELYVNMPYKVI
jgi:hypothetical protein